MDLGYSLAGAFVGFLVGLTGVGGGSLMAPILILVFGFSPALAIGTDLWFAAITKTAGGLIHHKLGSPDWKIVGRLAIGSLPAAVLTLLWLAHFHNGKLESDLLMQLLGAALMATAIVILARRRLMHPLSRLRDRMGRHLRHHQFLATLVGAACVGCLVTLTSVGAGALVAVMLALIYPLRMSARSIVGTDIVHAIPLTLIAALGHSWLGNVDVWVLASLLVGSIPGIIVASLLTGRVSDDLVRIALAIMLAVAAFKLLWS